jgi:hypothetical protein
MEEEMTICEEDRTTFILLLIRVSLEKLCTFIFWRRDLRVEKVSLEICTDLSIIILRID